MFCKQCGAQLNDGTAFCTNCGAKQTAEAPQPQPQPQAQPQQPAYAQSQSQSQSQPQPQAQPGYRANPAPQMQQQQYYGAPGAGAQGQQQYYGAAPQVQQQFVPSNGKVGFGQAIKLFFTNYVNFKGRATKSEFWYAVLFNFLLSLVLGWIPVVGWIITLGLAIPGLAIGVRRLHDIGKPWPWILMGLIPFAGPIILIVYYCKDSVGDNQWGRGPVTFGAPYYQPAYQNPAQQPPYAGAQQPQAPYGNPAPNPAQQNVPPTQNNYPYGGQQ